MDHEEERRHPRFICSAEGIVKWEGGEGPCHLSDISCGGACIRPPSEFQTSTGILILNIEGLELECQFEVVRGRSSTGPRKTLDIGIRFSSLISLEDFERITETL